MKCKREVGVRKNWFEVEKNENKYPLQLAVAKDTECFLLARL